MAGEELFRTTRIGGFDKENVLEQFQKLKDDAAQERNRLQAEIRQKEERIQELTRKLENKQDEIDRLERDIREKYQSYIDNYDTISRLVFDAEVRSKKIIGDAEGKSREIVDSAQGKSQEIIRDAEDQSREIADKAQQEKNQILEQAREAARGCLEDVQTKVDEKLAEGKKRYMAVQEELTDIVDLLNQVQRRFMQSYKAVHTIISSAPDTLLSEETEEELARVGLADSLPESKKRKERQERKETKQAGSSFGLPEDEDCLDEADDPEEEEKLEEQMRRILHKDED